MKNSSEKNSSEPAKTTLALFLAWRPAISKVFFPVAWGYSLNKYEFLAYPRSLSRAFYLEIKPDEKTRPQYWEQYYANAPWGPWERLNIKFSQMIKKICSLNGYNKKVPRLESQTKTFISKMNWKLIRRHIIKCVVQSNLTSVITIVFFLNIENVCLMGSSGLCE